MKIDKTFFSIALIVRWDTSCGFGATVQALSSCVASLLGKRWSRIRGLTALSSWRLRGGSLWHCQGPSPLLGLSWEALAGLCLVVRRMANWDPDVQKSGSDRHTTKPWTLPSLQKPPGKTQWCCRVWGGGGPVPQGRVVSGSLVQAVEGFLANQFWLTSPGSCCPGTKWVWWGWSQTTYTHISGFRFQVGVLFILQHDEFRARSGLC